ncbi:MAG: GNAT family N-acetyltransferase [Alphaproteobacteria bacterium]|jgi:predicted acetyltransferase|nr:MAG: GNAT family N-acetyltransferase [Alphaproteobacteria bacterium]
MDKVSLERGEPSQHETLTNLVQLYIHDFNDFLSPDRKIAIEESGRYPDVLRLDDYWREPDRSVWFIRAGGALAGFALFNRHSHCGLPVDHNMGEFFVTRAYRRDGIGARAAIDLITMHPGQWEIAVGARNMPALAFWPRVVASLDTENVETRDGDGRQWTGPITRFVIRAPATISIS